MHDDTYIPIMIYTTAGWYVHMHDGVHMCTMVCTHAWWYVDMHDGTCIHAGTNVQVSHVIFILLTVLNFSVAFDPCL